jgi:hypothetical protein
MLIQQSCLRAGDETPTLKAYVGHLAGLYLDYVAYIFDLILAVS